MINPPLEKLISTGLQLSRDHIKIRGLSYELQTASYCSKRFIRAEVIQGQLSQ